MRPPHGRPPEAPSLDPPPARLALIDPARVAAVVPAWNETGKIGLVVRKVPRRWAATLIVVDDHSNSHPVALDQPDLVRRTLQKLVFLEECAHAGNGYYLPTPLRLVELPAGGVELS